MRGAPSSPAAPSPSSSLRAGSAAQARIALFVAIGSAPGAAIASALTYVLLGVFDAAGDPMLPDILVALLAGIAVTMFSAALVVVTARRAAGDGRADTALALVPWTGTFGAMLGGALPVALWLAMHP